MMHILQANNPLQSRGMPCLNGRVFTGEWC